jgi:hypothetical protein
MGKGDPESQAGGVGAGDTPPGRARGRRRVAKPTRSQESYLRKRKRGEDDWASVWPKRPILGLHRKLDVIFVESLAASVAAFTAACELPSTRESAMERALRRGSEEPVPRDVLASVVEFVNRSWRPTDALTVAGLETEVFQGATALDDFAMRISSPERQRLPWSQFLPRGYDEGAIPGAITEFLEARDLRNLMVLAEEDATPAAATIIARLAGQARKARDAGAAGAGAGSWRTRDICHLPVNWNPVNGRAITTATLAGHLWAWCRGDHAPNQGEAPHTAAELRETWDAIVDYMCRRPFILVLSGATSLGVSLASVRSLILDDPVAPLLRELLRGPVEVVKDGKLDPAADPMRYFENRILVFSDRDIPGFDAYRAEYHGQKLSDFTGLEPFTGRAHAADLKSVCLSRETQAEDTLDILEARLNLEKAGPYNADDLETGARASRLKARLRAPRREGERAQLRVSAVSAAQAFRGLAEHLDPVTLLSLQMAAMVQTSLRLTTLRRLLRIWGSQTLAADRRAARKTARERAGQPPDDEADDEAEDAEDPGVSPFEVDLRDLERRLFPLAPIAAPCCDEALEGLDSAPAHLLLVDDDPELDADWDVLKAIAIRSERLRMVVLQHLMEADPSHTARLHRIISEEAVRHETRIMAYGDLAEVQDIRFFRRHFQTLFHAFASLQQGANARHLPSTTPPHILPVVSRPAFTRLYGVFVEKYLDHGKERDLARTMGRDAAKADILLMALNSDNMDLSWSTLFYDRKASLGVRRPRTLTLEPSDPKHLQNGMILADILVSLARAKYHTHDLEGARKALQEGRWVLEDLGRACEAARARDAARAKSESPEFAPWEYGRVEACLTENRTRLDKCELDLVLLSDPESCERVGVRMLLQTGFFNGHETGEIAAITQQVRRAASEFRVRRALRSAAEKVTAAPHRRRVEPSIVEAWCDILGRIGEAKAILAEGEGEAESRAELAFNAFVYFYVAEQFRRVIFDADLLSDHYVPSAHTTRMMVRTALRMIEHRRDLAAVRLRGGRLPTDEFFVHQADRHIGILTRYFFRQTAEHPSFKLLTAARNRVVGQAKRRRAVRRKPVPDLLKEALEEIAGADKIMFVVPDRPRVRLRLLSERWRVLYRLARVEKDTPNSTGRSSAFWLKLAANDTIRLVRLVRELESQYWSKLALGQRRDLEKLIGEMGLNRADFGLETL